VRNVHFNLDEIFDMAERIERNGFKFYTHQAGRFPDPDVKRMFEELAEMEADHEKTFASMRANLQGELKAPTAPFDPASQADEYLWAWTDSHVFKVADDPLAGLTGSETSVQVMEMAIEREKDSVVFYQGLSGSLANAVDVKAVDEIISEEMQHIAMLTGMIRLLESHCG
jgi:rubrerythrin